ncbi:MAG: DUF4177 domain-containing protein [Paracoccus sp. (in: a-proteobacteria)]|nr:DUF4177 domain-containing protein [Paracoccus sp. (in: a-proteobacteria)]
MTQFEYTVIPAPARSEKIKGAKTPADRYAVALGAAINEMAAQGWDYVRAETLPSEERSGLTGRTVMFHNLLVFRRAKAVMAQAPAPREAEPAPAAARPEPETTPGPQAAMVTQAGPAPAPAALAAVTPDAPVEAEATAAEPGEAKPATPVFSRTMQMLGGASRGVKKD